MSEFLAHDQHITLGEWLVAFGAAIAVAVLGLALAYVIHRVWPLYPRKRRP